MNNNAKKIFNLLKSIRLTEEEREQMKAEILDRIAEKPKAAGVLAFFGHLNFARAASVALIAVLAVGTGISFAAASSLPGDFLFPYKTTVNEGIENILTFSSKDKAELNAEFAKSRLQETEKLISEGRLTAEAQKEAQVDFEKKTEKVKKYMEEAKSDGNESKIIDISSHIESSLKAHETILTAMSEQKKIIAKTMPIVNSVTAQGNDIINRRIDAEARIKEKNNEGRAEVLDAPASGKGDSAGDQEEKKAKNKAGGNEGLKKDAQDAKKQAEENLASLKNSISRAENKPGGSAASKDGKLETAGEIMNEGKVMFENGRYIEAFLTFQKAKRLIGEVETYFEAENNLKNGHVTDDGKNRENNSEEKRGNEKNNNGGQNRRIRQD